MCHLSGGIAVLIVKGGYAMTDQVQRTGISDMDIADKILPAEVNEDVIRFYAPMVYRIALTKTKSSYDADDIFQEVFIRLASSKLNFESEEHRKAWLIRVTISRCNSHFTAPWRKNITSIDEHPETEDIEDSDENEDSENVLAQVLALPQNMRDVILLYYYEDMSVREIAQTLKISEDNVKKRLSRARQRLKLELTNEVTEAKK